VPWAHALRGHALVSRAQNRNPEFPLNIDNYATLRA
jgi:hypothetical protein